MATDFFEQQDVARRKTTRLVVLFVLAVIAMIVSIDLLLAATMGYLGRDPETGAIDWMLAFDPEIVLLAVVGTLIVVAGGSLFKIAQLRGGGHVVAEQLGGRRLNPDTTVPSERQLLNVVEEMAIASGTPAPPVFLMDQEPGINAFAAGFTPSDAVIGVTRGSAEQLSRDELQGVIAHEFSHILNGDMRLNIRLIGLLHGILIIGMIGYFVLRMAAFSGSGYRRSRDRNNPLPLLALGAGLMAVGFFGTLFGNMIKAALSRQREFLADASAVQFTRNPGGLAGALKKIGGYVAGTAIESPNAPEASHMFFGRATSGVSQLFSTHPPLRERITRIEPSWSGEFPEVAPLGPRGSARAPGQAAAAVSGLAASPGVDRQPHRLANVVEDVGRPSEAHIQYARILMERLPPRLVAAAREPHGARALIYALLLDRRPEPRQRQIAHLAAAADRGVYEETVRLAPDVGEIDVRMRLPLIDIALPALRALTPDQHRLFAQNVVELVKADEQIDLFEWSLHRILMHELAAGTGRGQRHGGRRSLADVRRPAEVMLSALAYAGHRDAGAATTAFEAARRELDLPPSRLCSPDECGLDALSSALSALDEAAPSVKRQVLQAAVACIAADRLVTATEAELLRAVAASFGVPMPPLIDEEFGARHAAGSGTT